jgi:oxygen-independent coproporphyrinogen-3 oxidase
MIREFILQMKLGHVHREYFQQKFGVDVRQRFAAPLGHLVDEGLLRVDAQDLQLNRNGLLQVDRLLWEFFLPQHRGTRYS